MATMEQGKRSWFRKIREERQLRGWSQAELAEKVGADTKSVSRWESGSHLPSYAAQRKLSEFYGQTLEELGFFVTPSNKAEEMGKTSPFPDSPSVKENLDGSMDLEIEKQKLEIEKQKLEIEEQRLELLERRLKLQKNAIEVARQMIEMLNPSENDRARAAIIEALWPDIFALLGSKSLEILSEPPSGKSE